MNVDRQTLAELASRLQSASGRAAHTRDQLAGLRPTGSTSADAAWLRTMADLASIDAEITIMRRMLNVLWLRAVHAGQPAR